MIRFINERDYKNNFEKKSSSKMMPTVNMTDRVFIECSRLLSSDEIDVVKVLCKNHIVIYAIAQGDYIYDQAYGLLGVLKNRKYAIEFGNFLRDKYKSIKLEKINQLSYDIYTALKDYIPIELEGDFWEQIINKQSEPITQSGLTIVSEPICNNNYITSTTVGRQYKSFIDNGIEIGANKLEEVLPVLGNMCKTIICEFPVNGKFSELSLRFKNINNIHNKIQGYCKYENDEEKEIVKELYGVSTIEEITRDEYVVFDLGDGFIGKSFSPGVSKKTLYIIGPCIVSGYCVNNENTFSYIMDQEIKNYGYKVVKIWQSKVNWIQMDKLLDIPIRSDDLILFVSEKGAFPKQIENVTYVDAAEFINSLDEHNSYFSDCAIHLTAKGHNLFEKYVYEKCIKDLLVLSETTNTWKNIGNVVNNEIRLRIADYAYTYAESKNYNDIGCIVMNCNPFTKGHLYLIKEALNRVDFLYVFIVEEDKSFFSFKDRMAMVKQGTTSIKNIKIVPSGEFILSARTLPSYFEKEKLQNRVIDATSDIGVFGRYIVPYFNIKKRFVGTEPYDLVTRQYNEQMKEWLSEFGVELIEIPREKEGRKSISASEVRRALQYKNWEYIETLVPDTTYKYLKNIYK